jgi:hypothetical protein
MPGSIARLFLGAGIALMLTGAQAADDIVWPTYAQIQHTGDAGLSCSQLRDVIAHVKSDIAMLNKAHDRTEALVRNQFAYDSSHGTDDYNRFRLGTAGDGEQDYLEAREQIGVSHGVAVRRLYYLNELEKTCKTVAP